MDMRAVVFVLFSSVGSLVVAFTSTFISRVIPVKLNLHIISDSFLFF